MKPGRDISFLDLKTLGGRC